MRKFALALILISLLLLLASSLCFAEDEGRRFVDARDGTGYFVDVTTVSIDSNHEYTANVAIVKAKENRLFSYRMHFDFAARTYQILRSATMTYDTREVSQRTTTPAPAAPYVAGSPIAAVVDYLYAWQRGYEK
ncbi:hypothetical protein [Selenomonas sp.]|uniref:hypothetical protein n=1 Tax=Selenomonas sp. TaxID=2053611 RepID=UPI003FA31BED